MKYTITGRSLIEGTSSAGFKVYDDSNINVRVLPNDYTVHSPYYLHLKAGKKIYVTAKKNIDFLSTNLYFVNNANNNISNNPQSIIHSDTGTGSYEIQSSKDIGILSFNGKSYDDIYISTNNKVNFVLYYKVDDPSDYTYHNIVLQVGSTNLSDSICPMYYLPMTYAQRIGIGWDSGNGHMDVDEASVITAITSASYSDPSNTFRLTPTSDSSKTYQLVGSFSSDSPVDTYLKNYRYAITTNTIDSDEDFKLTYTIDEYEGYTIQQFNKTALSSFTVDSSTTNILYNKINVNIPTKEYVLDLHKLPPPSGRPSTIEGNPVSDDGTIAEIEPTDYLINKISGNIRVTDMTFTSTENGENTYKHDTQFYNAVTVNTNVQSIGDIETNLNIRNIKCDTNSLFYDECSITFYLDVYVNENYSVYISTDNNNFSLYSGDDIELPIDLRDIKKNIYYKLKNNIDNTYTSVSCLQIPVEGYLLNAIDIPNIKVERTSNNNFSIYIENIESIDHGFICSLNINDKIYTLDNIDNAYVDITTTEKYINIESYFYKMIHRKKCEGKITRLIVDTDSLAVIELSTIEYRDPAYVYSKVPTKYYGVYLTLLKLLSDNGETLLNDCASACKSSSHKLTSLWNMFNAACGAYLNDNKKLADVLIKTITSQLNIMYDENFDFLQHRIFIGNYTLENKNNPNEFNTVYLYKLTPTEYDVCSDIELTFTIKQTSDIHYIMLPPELDLKYVSFGDTIKTVLFDSANNINLYKTRSWRMADKDTDGTIYWYYSPAGAFDDIITVVCKHK